MIFDGPITFVEAVNQLARKRLMPTNLGSGELMELSRAMRERSFFSAHTVLEDLLGGYKERIGKILEPKTELRVQPDGTSKPVTVGMDYATARLETKNFLRSVGYGAEPGEAGTIKDLSSDARINLVLKTNVEMAQGFGQRQQGNSEGALDEFPCQELFRLEDRKEPRDWLSRWQGAGGRLFEGRMIARKDDPIWEEISAFGQPYPPFDFGSGMWVRDISREEAERLGVIETEEVVTPARLSFAMEGGSATSQD